MDRQRAAMRLVVIAATCLDEAAIGGDLRVMGLDLAAARTATAAFASRLAAISGQEALTGRPPFENMIDYRGENMQYNA